MARNEHSPKHRFIQSWGKSGKLDIDRNDPNRIETTPISKASQENLKDRKDWLKQIDCGEISGACHGRASEALVQQGLAMAYQAKKKQTASICESIKQHKVNVLGISTKWQSLHLC